MLSYAIIGFGGLGRVHLANLDKIAKQRKDFYLKAICGTTAEAFKESVSINLGTADVSQVNIDKCIFYNDYKALIDKEKPDFIISALPTYMHEEAAVYALERGIHVFSEKPMAISLMACENMMKAADANQKKLMIGQCLRFDPMFNELKRYIDSGVYGKVYRAEFTRYSQLPLWTRRNWILDVEKSGGCPIDMHIHDVDLINWLFGIPVKVHSTATGARTELESIFTQYYYDDLVVTAGADWSLPQTFPFEARCLVNFEKATVVISGGKMTVYTDDEILTPDVSDESYFESEMKAFLEMVIDDKPCDRTSAESILDTMKLAMAEIESVKSGKTVNI